MIEKRSPGCLCTCGHRTPQHHLFADGATPCAECGCLEVTHADGDPLCAFPDLPKRQSGKVNMDRLEAKIVYALEPILGPKRKP